MRQATQIAVALIASALVVVCGSGTPRLAHADPVIFEPEYGNLFKCGLHALAAEMRYQPPDALLEGARVLNTKGMCFRGKGWLTAWDLAVQIMVDDQQECLKFLACQGFFLYETVEPDRQEMIAEAVNQAMIESPQIARYHFDAMDAPYASWWYNPAACPSGFWFVGSLRFC